MGDLCIDERKLAARESPGDSPRGESNSLRKCSPEPDSRTSKSRSSPGRESKSVQSERQDTGRTKRTSPGRREAGERSENYLQQIRNGNSPSKKWPQSESLGRKQELKSLAPPLGQIDLAERIESWSKYVVNVTNK